MNDETITIRPPIWFWIVSGVALVWNLMGIMAFVGQATMSYDKMVETFGRNQADVIAAQPTWYMIVFACAVLGGVIGCVGLLLRKRWALWALLVSLVGVFFQQVYIFLLSNAGSSVRGGEWVMVLLIPIVAILLFMLARRGVDKGWLQ